jgi:hypothetical protein
MVQGLSSPLASALPLRVRFLMLTPVPTSRQAIQKYIKANNSIGEITEPMFKSHVNRAIAKGEKDGVFTRPKGTCFMLLYFGWWIMC